METTNVMMKFILTTIVFLALAISGVAQTRNVIVNTNGVIQSPTNFWSADVTNARSGLGLGTAATSPASAFQPSSAILTNLSLGNGSGLTNVTASSISSALAISNTTGLQAALDGKLATNGNTTGTASNVTGVVALANGGTGSTNASTARTSLGATTVGGNIFTLVNPDDVRFLRLNANNSVSALTATDFRTAIGASTGLGTVTSVGLTVPNIFLLTGSPITSNGTFAITLQTQSSRNFLAAPNLGGVPSFRAIDSDDLPSLAISKVTGLQTALDGKLATNGTATLANNVTGIVALANGGTGGSNAATGRTGLGATTVGSSLFTLVNPSDIRFLRVNNDNTVSALSDSDFRTAIGLGTAATNPATAFQPSSLALSNLASSNGGALTNLTGANITGTVALASNVTGTVAISNGGSGATTAGGARTNFGLTFSALTNSDSNSFRSAIGLGISNSVSFESVSAINGSIKVLEGTNEVVLLNSDEASYFANPINFLNTNALNLTRDHLGLKRIVTTDQGQSGWITFIYDDTNATNPIISVGGQAGVTLYGPIIFGGAATVTNRALSRTNLGLGWSALTNTNTSGFNASLYGNGTNPVLYNTNGEVVSPTNFYQVYPITTTFIESQPTTNQTTNMPAGRNLHIHSIAPSTVGITNTIALPTNPATTFDGDIALVVHQGPTSSVTAVRTAGASTNLITLNQFEEAVEFVYYNSVWQFNHNLSYIEPIFFSGTNAAANAAASRTNLGLPLAALTNTNNADFRTAIELGATNSVSFSNVTASGDLTSTGNLVAISNASVGGTLTVTSTVTAKTNLVVEGFVDYTAARTNNTPTNIPNFAAHAAWIEVKVGTNSFFLPAYQ